MCNEGFSQLKITVFLRKERRIISVGQNMNIAISTGIDLFLLAVFIIAVFLSVRKGLLKSIIGLVGNILAAAAAFLFSSPLGAYIDSHFLHQSMRQWMINILSPTAQTTTASLSNLNFDELFADMPQFFSDILKNLNIDGVQLADQYTTLKANGEEAAKSAIIDIMVSPMSELCSRVIAFVVIFLLALIAINILVWLLDFVVNLPVLRQINKLGGAVLGVINGIIFVFLLSGIISVSIGYIMKDKSSEEINSITESTLIYKTVNSINPVRMIFDGWKS